MAAGGADGPLAARPGQRRAAPAATGRDHGIVSTHTVFNQVPPLEDYSLYETDPALRAAVARSAAAWEGDLAAHGAWLGRAQTLAAGDEANRHPPRLISYDRGGHRVDQIEFHPSWRLLMGGVVARGLHSRAWAQPAPGAQAARAAAYLMQGQVEAGTLCPTTMTFAAVPLLQREPAGVVDFGGDWLPALYSREFDGADAPLTAKRGALIGMGLTEKQGGSDLRAISTRATPLGAPGRGCAYQLVGHKWFYSVPQADAHLVLAQADGAQLLLARWIPGGPRNAVRALPEDRQQQRQRRGRVRGRLGRDGGRAGPRPVGAAEMAATTRLDCVLGRRAGRAGASSPPSQAARRLAQRAGRPRCEASMRGRCWRCGARAVAERALARVGKRRPPSSGLQAVAECLEAWGGNGYVEDGPMPRLYRETPVNSVWEGSGNVMALDVLRALQREPEGMPRWRASWTRPPASTATTTPRWRNGAPAWPTRRRPRSRPAASPPGWPGCGRRRC